MPAGQRTKPVDLHIIDGKWKQGKKAIAERRAAEIKLGDQKFKIPSILKNNAEASKKWHWVLKLYKEAGFTLVTTGDTAILERYCLLWADYRKIRTAIQKLEEHCDWDESGRAFCYAYKYLDVDVRLHKIYTQINMLEDKLYLNPVAKARTTKLQQEAEKSTKSELDKQGFGSV